MAKRRTSRKQSRLQPAAQSALVPVARYDAASHGRRMRGWVAPGTGPNRAASGLGTIRNRARDATRNEWSGASGERVWATSLIGIGIVARPQTRDPALKARFTSLWDAFCSSADADGVLDFYGLQTLAVRSWVTSGEVFIRMRPRRVDDGLEVPLQVQLLESDMVPLLDADAWPGLPAGNRIRQGVELNRIGRRVAYWVHREHPGDGSAFGASRAELVRIPADQMRHMFEPRRPGQLRGVSDFAPVLAKLRGVGNYDDAVLTRQELANLYTAFVTRPDTPGAPRIDPTTGLPVEFDADGAPMLGLEPGLMQELGPGQDVKFSAPPDAGANYAEFMRQQHLGVASGSGQPYELLTGDIRDVSDRTLRVVINEFRRFCEQRQWQIVIPMFCQPVRDAVAAAAALVGLLTPDEAREFRRVTWAPHAWPYIHPTQDVQAKKMERDAGFKSRSQIISERGDDPDEVDAERAEDAARERRLGLTPEIPPQAPAARGGNTAA